MAEQIEDTWYNGLRLRVALQIAMLHQKAGTSFLNYLEPLLTLLWNLQRFLDPIKVPEGCYNWAALEALRRQLGWDEDVFWKGLDEAHEEAERRKAGLPPKRKEDEELLK